MYWVGDPACQNKGPEERLLIENQARLKVVAEVQDESLSYEFDEWAIVELDGQFYACQASGCSCPSPTETWCVVMGPCPLDEIYDAFANSKYPGFKIPDAELESMLMAMLATLNTSNGSKA